MQHSVSRRERCMLLASAGAEMTKRIQGTLLAPFKTVLHVDQIEHIASIIWSYGKKLLAVSGSASQDMHSSLQGTPKVNCILGYLESLRFTVSVTALFSNIHFDIRSLIPGRCKRFVLQNVQSTIHWVLAVVASVL